MIKEFSNYNKELIERLDKGEIVYCKEDAGYEKEGFVYNYSKEGFRIEGLKVKYFFKVEDQGYFNSLEKLKIKDEPKEKKAWECIEEGTLCFVFDSLKVPPCYVYTYLNLDMSDKVKRHKTKHYYDAPIDVNFEFAVPLYELNGAGELLLRAVNFWPAEMKKKWGLYEK